MTAKSEGAPTVRPLYVRPKQAIQIVPVSRRTLSNWQKSRVVPFYRIGRCVLFKLSDLERTLERYRIAPVGEVRPRRTIETGSITTEPVMPRKRRAGHDY